MLLKLSIIGYAFNNSIRHLTELVVNPDNIPETHVNISKGDLIKHLFMLGETSLIYLSFKSSNSDMNWLI